jgi:Tol biopolymer transport system component
MTRALALLVATVAAVLAGTASTAAAPVAHIASITVDGADTRVLSGAEPAWRPSQGRDGRILFYRRGVAVAELWVMEADGSGARKLVDAASDGFGPSEWSPTSGAFATTGWDESPCGPGLRNCAISEIRVHDGATGEIRTRLRSRGRGAYAYSWSPDGRRIASLGALDMDLNAYTVEVANADGAARRVLVRTRFPNWLTEIAWSPRGDRIAYVQRGWIWLVRASSGNPERVAKGRRLLWSPRGELLYSAPEGRRLLDPVTKRSRLLLSAPAYIAAWSPDGARIAYRASYTGGVTTIAVVRASDGRVLSRPRVTGKVTSLHFADGGRRLLYGASR